MGSVYWVRIRRGEGSGEGERDECASPVKIGQQAEGSRKLLRVGIQTKIRSLPFSIPRTGPHTQAFRPPCPSSFESNPLHLPAYLDTAKSG